MFALFHVDYIFETLESLNQFFPNYLENIFFFFLKIALYTKEKYLNEVFFIFTFKTHQNYSIKKYVSIDAKQRKCCIIFE